MPIVTIKFLEGRSDDQKKALVKDVTDVIAADLKAPKENIHVILEEMKKNGLRRCRRSQFRSVIPEPRRMRRGFFSGH